MTTWNYIIGSEKDFEGAPDEATIVTIDDMRRKHFGDVFPVPGAKYWSDLGGKGEWGNGVKSIQWYMFARRDCDIQCPGRLRTHRTSWTCR